MRTTHTYVTLELSAAAFDEIKSKLEAAGYADTFIPADGDEEPLRIPMQGIAVTRASVPRSATLGWWWLLRSIPRHVGMLFARPART